MESSLDTSPEALDNPPLSQDRTPEVPDPIHQMPSAEQDKIFDRLHLLDKQVADLQADQISLKKPWHKDVSTIIALLAFAFSFGSTLFSYRQVYEQRIHDDRAELRSLLQRLSSLPRENYEAMKNYNDNPSVFADISGFLQQENLLLTGQASEIADSIPGYVGAEEYLAIANSWLASNTYDRSVEFFVKAERVAKNEGAAVTSLRGQGNVYFQLQRPEAARDALQKAIKIVNNSRHMASMAKAFANTQTEMVWANAEMNQRHCAEAKIHLAAARKYSAPYSVPKSTMFVESQMNQLQQTLTAICG